MWPATGEDLSSAINIDVCCEYFHHDLYDPVLMSVPHNQPRKRLSDKPENRQSAYEILGPRARSAPYVAV
jgi:hypothetical protein